MGKEFGLSTSFSLKTAVRCGSLIRLIGIGTIGFLWLMIPPSGDAHSGGLDKMGCHHDRKKGGYHCHRGPLAGQSFSTKEEAMKVLETKQQAQANSKKDEAKSKQDPAGGER